MELDLVQIEYFSTKNNLEKLTTNAVNEFFAMKAPQTAVHVSTKHVNDKEISIFVSGDQGITIYLDGTLVKSYQLKGLNCKTRITPPILYSYLTNAFPIISRNNLGEYHVTFHPKAKGGGSFYSSCYKQEPDTHPDKEFVVDDQQDIIFDKKKSEAATNLFETNFNTFMTHYRKNKPKEMKESLEKLLNADLGEIYDVGRYFEEVFTEVLGRKQLFTKIDIDQRFGLKEDILHLLHNLALVHFYLYKKYGIKIESKEAEDKIAVLKRYLDWAKASEEKLSFSEIIFSLELVIDLIQAMPESQNFLDKLGMKSQLKGMIWNIVTLNISKGAVDLVQGLSKAALMVIAENLQQDIINNPTVSILHIQALVKSLYLADSKDEKLINCFMAVVEKALGVKVLQVLDWKVYYKLAWALGEIATLVEKKELQERLLFEESSRGYANLECFVKFSNFWMPRYNGWRIRERAIQEFCDIFEKISDKEIKRKIHALLIASTIQNDHKITQKIKKRINDIDKADLAVKQAAKNIISKQTDELTIYLQELAAKSQLLKNDEDLAKEKAVRQELVTIQRNLAKTGMENVRDLIHEIAGKRAYAGGNYKEAIKHYRDDIQYKKAKYGEASMELAFAYRRLGLSYLAEGDYDKALEWFQKALDIKIVKSGGTNLSVATFYNDLGNAYVKKKDYNEAIKQYKKALEIRESKYGLNHFSVAQIYFNIGKTYDAQENYDDALTYYSKGLDILLKRYGTDDGQVASTYLTIGAIYQKKEQYDQAIEFFQKALKVYSFVYGPLHYELGDVYHNLAQAYEKTGQPEEALINFGKAFDIYSLNYGNDHPETVETQQNIVEMRHTLSSIP